MEDYRKILKEKCLKDFEKWYLDKYLESKLPSVQLMFLDMFWEKPAVEIQAYILEFFELFKTDLNSVHVIKNLNSSYNEQKTKKEIRKKKHD